MSGNPVRAVVRRAAYLTPVLKIYLAERVRLRAELETSRREAAAARGMLEEAIMARLRLAAEVERLAAEVAQLRTGVEGRKVRASRPSKAG